MSKSRVIVIVQARTGSTRLPNKVLLPLNGHSVLEEVIERVKKAKLIDSIVVATTMKLSDLKIVQKSIQANVHIYCGSELDVLDRYYQASRIMKADHVVRITADCPLLDASIIDRVISTHINSNSDYSSNVSPPTFPDGLDVEVFTFASLFQAWTNAKLPSEREHVTPYIRNHAELFKQINIKADNDFSSKRWTLDNSEDYKFLTKLFQSAKKKNSLQRFTDILKILEKYPELEKINQNIERNLGYKKSLIEDQSKKMED